MRDSRYHGGFDHPLRSFLIGVTLLVLLFGGFAVGIEAGARPSSARATSTITVGGERLRVVTVQQPVVRTTVGQATTIVRLLSDRTAAVVRDGDSTLVGYLDSRHRGATVASSSFQPAGTIYLPAPTTVTQTVTETETVTDTTSDTTPTTVTTSTP